MADHYFKKVLPAPRDKWMARMIDSYPCHPLTQAVLANHIAAEAAARRYPRQAAGIDKMIDRFPTSPYCARGYSQRVFCYETEHDEEGRLAFVRRMKAPAAETGDVRAVAELAKYELADIDDYEKLGDAWVARAEKYAGTRTEVYCLRRAWGAYYYTPYHRRQRDKVVWDKAMGVIRRLRAQKLDPELGWKLAFADVNLLARQGKGAAALSALNAKLKARPTWRDLSLRLEMAAVGAALGGGGKPDQAVALARRLKGCCVTRRDLAGIELLQAGAYVAAKDYEKGATHYLSLVNASPFPASLYSYFNSGASLLSQARSKKYTAAIEAYMRRIGRTQELVPGLLYQLGLHHARARGPAALAARNRLAGRYPCSAARDKLEKVFASLRPRKPKPRPKPRR